MKKKKSTGTPSKTKREKPKEVPKKVIPIGKGKKVKYPFIIHADALKEDTAFPTHTHGLSAIDWPEFFMDPLAFGGIGNSGRINAAYRYFSKPQNAGQLEAILNGEVVKLHSQDLHPGTDEDYTYCFRLVSHDFEGVKLAYPEETEIENMRFVQIWVEGDDFALLDEYYKGGVKW